MPIDHQSAVSLTRRKLLQAGACGFAGIVAAPGLFVGGTPLNAAEAPLDYSGLQTAKYLGEVQTAATVKGDKVFTEGPTADRHGQVYFTNEPPKHVLRYTVKSGELTVFRENSHAANGLLIDPQGRLVACEGGLNGDGRVTRMDVETGKLTTLADAFGGKPLGAPNDLAFDAQGRIYFTSRLLNTDPQVGNVNSVYRIDPSGEISRILAAPDIDMPNGIVTSPDDKLLYLVESDGRENRARCIRAYDLASNGVVSNGRILINFYPGRSGDGMAVDTEGNLYVAAGLHKTRGTSETLATKPGIHVISPLGKLLAFVGTPEDTITNCRFGGEDLRTLYVTCGKFLLTIRTQIPGKSLYRPKK